MIRNQKTHLLIKLWTAAIPLIILSYFYLDRPLADFIYAHHWRMHLSLFSNLIEWPPVMVGIAPLLFLFALIGRKNHSQAKWPMLLVTMSVSILLAYFLKNDLKWVFSRDWPETWISNNPSWISNHAYGFQWFQGKIFMGNDATGSFPSGHSTLAFATLTPIGLYYRRFFLGCLTLASIEAFSMLAFNYHFLSDIIAGSALGFTCACLCHGLLARE